MAKPVSIEVYNPSGKYRVISTKSMPGTRWINLLVEQDCRVEVNFVSFFFYPIYNFWDFFAVILFMFDVIPSSILSWFSFSFSKFRFVPRTKPSCLLRILLL